MNPHELLCEDPYEQMWNNVIHGVEAKLQNKFNNPFFKFEPDSLVARTVLIHINWTSELSDKYGPFSMTDEEHDALSSVYESYDGRDYGLTLKALNDADYEKFNMIRDMVIEDLLENLTHDRERKKIDATHALGGLAL